MGGIARCGWSDAASAWAANAANEGSPTRPCADEPSGSSGDQVSSAALTNPVPEMGVESRARDTVAMPVELIGRR